MAAVDAAVVDAAAVVDVLAALELLAEELDALLELDAEDADSEEEELSL